MIKSLERGRNIDVVKAMAMQSTLTIPTPLGIPSYSNISAFSALKVDGRVQLSGDVPKFFDMEHKDDITFSFDFVPK